MPNRGKASGKKVTKSHQTVIDAAQSLVRAAEPLPYVSKIVLGIIRSSRSSRAHRQLKIVPIPAGLKLIVRSNMYLQDLYIYTTDREALTRILEDAFA